MRRGCSLVGAARGATAPAAEYLPLMTMPLSSVEYLCRRVAHPVAVCLLLTAAVSSSLSAQRRPGVNMGFYTTTDLVTADVEATTVYSSTGQLRAPQFVGALLVSAPLKRQTRRAWIAGARATPLAVRSTSPCFRTPGVTECPNGRVIERLSVMAGGAFDIRSTILRAMVGPTLHQVEGKRVRFGTTLRLDFASPRLVAPTPTVFFSRTYLGSQNGRGAALTSVGIGFRWVRKQ